MNRQLPSFPSLRAFEAAARHLSFKAAADELCVTQSAISHQIKALEEFLEASLFLRGSNGVELTLRGSEYQAKVTHLMDGLEDATLKVKGGDKVGSLAVQAPPAFVSRWLLPRMIRFSRVHPDIELDLFTNRNLDDSEIRPFDIRINCSWDNPPNSLDEAFMSSPRLPVCSPELMKSGPAISSPEDLLHYPILRESAWDGWDEWFALAGYDNTPELNGPRLENAYMTLKAAEDGQGIALGPVALMTEEIALGRLVVLLEQEVAPVLVYTISYRKNWKRYPKIVAFRQWLDAELGPYSNLSRNSVGPKEVAR